MSTFNADENTESLIEEITIQLNYTGTITSNSHYLITE
jgi:hypothetical protein